MIIVVGGIKGGTGKSTIATNLAVSGSQIKKNVILIDADDQESAYQWSLQRPQILPNVTCLKLTGAYVFDQINRLKHQYDVVIIDTGGRDTASQRSALLGANLYIVPFRPRSLDLWTIQSLKEMTRDLKSLNPSLVFLGLINQADAQGHDTEQATQLLKESSFFHSILPSLGNRKAFANAVSLGLGVKELRPTDAKAITELNNLYKTRYLTDIFEI